MHYRECSDYLTCHQEHGECLGFGGGSYIHGRFFQLERQDTHVCGVTATGTDPPMETVIPTR